MKAKAIIFTGLALGLLGLAAPPHLRADNQTDQRNNNPPGQAGSVQTAPGNLGLKQDSSGAPGSDLSGQSSANQYSPPADQPPPPVDRASSLIGMKVKNPANQKLGAVKDVVFDLQTGRFHAFAGYEIFDAQHG